MNEQEEGEPILPTSFTESYLRNYERLRNRYAPLFKETMAAQGSGEPQEIPVEHIPTNSPAGQALKMRLTQIEDQLASPYMAGPFAPGIELTRAELEEEAMGIVKKLYWVDGAPPVNWKEEEEPFPDSPREAELPLRMGGKYKSTFFEFWQQACAADAGFSKMEGLRPGVMVMHVLPNEQVRPAWVIKVSNPFKGIVDIWVMLHPYDDLKYMHEANQLQSFGWAANREYDENHAPGSWHWPERKL